MLGTIYFYAATIGGVFLLLQLLFMFVGGEDGGEGGGDADLDLDLGGDGAADHDAGLWVLEIISLRTLAAAAMFFGLTGLTGQAYNFNENVTLALALFAGFAAMYSVYWAFKQLFRLRSSGSEDIRNAVGRCGQIYVPVPPHGAGLGKIHFEMQGRIVEYQASSDEDRVLATGEHVEIVDVVNSDTVQVRPLGSA